MLSPTSESPGPCQFLQFGRPLYAILYRVKVQSKSCERNLRMLACRYFHNWTGNRVTCRDWFQLTLKEGLTVFRDQVCFTSMHALPWLHRTGLLSEQSMFLFCWLINISETSECALLSGTPDMCALQEFSSDMNSRPVKRIEDVSRLRTAQFTEDAGSMAHPIRPDSYIKMDNFYTLTVYEKGAEIVRLYRTLLGKDGFRYAHLSCHGGIASAHTVMGGQVPNAHFQAARTIALVRCTYLQDLDERQPYLLEIWRYCYKCHI